MPRSPLAFTLTDDERAQCRIHWQFTSQDARIKLAHLYPTEQISVD